MTARRSTPAQPATPTAPTPASPDLLAGLLAMRATPRTSRVGQSATLLAGTPQPATGPVGTATATRTATRTGKLPAGYPIVPDHGRTVTELPEGYFWAVRVFHAGSESAQGDVRAFRIDGTGDLPATTPGSHFTSWHGSNRADCGTWEVQASKPALFASKPVRVNVLYPRPAAS